MHNTRRSGKEKLTYVPELTKLEKSNRKQIKGKSKEKVRTVGPIKMADDGNNNNNNNRLVDAQADPFRHIYTRIGWYLT